MTTARPTTILQTDSPLYGNSNVYCNTIAQYKMISNTHFWLTSQDYFLFARCTVILVFRADRTFPVQSFQVKGARLETSGGSCDLVSWADGTNSCKRLPTVIFPFQFAHDNTQRIRLKKIRVPQGLNSVNLPSISLVHPFLSSLRLFFLSEVSVFGLFIPFHCVFDFICLITISSISVSLFIAVFGFSSYFTTIS